MNILQLVPKLEVGGVETGTVDLARYLTLKAHKAVIISGGGSLVKRLDEVGARHYTLPIGRKNPFTILFMVIKVCQIIKRENIDIVHARSRIPAIIGFFASRFTLKTFITTAHGQYKKHLTSYVMGWGKLVIVANTVMARYMINHFKVRPDKIRIVPRGVDTKRFEFYSPEEKKHKYFTVGMISRITPLKGHLDFIRAVSKVSRVVNNLKVCIAGNRKTAKDAYLKEIELLIKRLSLRGVVEFLDEVPNVSSILYKLDVLVSANMEQEAFGRIIIEAESCGVPCVATNVGGIPEIIEDGKTGLLCESSNPRDMAEKILTLYQDMGLRKKLAENARKSVEEKYTLNEMMDRTLKVYGEALGLLRILIVKISALGDVILAIPSIRAIRKRYPNAVIKVLVALENRDVLKNLPFIDGLIVVDFKKRDKGLNGFFRIANIVRKEDFDIVYDFQNNKKSHMLSFLSFAPLRYGYDNGKLGFLLNRKVKNKGPATDPVSHQKRVLKLAGIMDVDKKLTFVPSKIEEMWAQDFIKINWLSSRTPIICINLESSLRWDTKKWPIKYFLELSEKLAQQFFLRVIVTGQNPSDERNKTFLKSAKCKPVSAIGKTTLGQLGALIAKSDLLITSDSAPMHIAAGVGTPFIALFGPTDPARHVPYAEKCKIIKRDIKCGPCYKTSCFRMNACMKAIKPDEVFNAVCEMLALRDRRRGE